MRFRPSKRLHKCSPRGCQSDACVGKIALRHRALFDAFHDRVREQLAETAATRSERFAARTVLAEIIRWANDRGECSKIARDLSELLDINKAAMARNLALLERIHAIRRELRGKTKVILLTPTPQRRLLSPRS